MCLSGPESDQDPRPKTDPYEGRFTRTRVGTVFRDSVGLGRHPRGDTGTASEGPRDAGEFPVTVDGATGTHPPSGVTNPIVYRSVHHSDESRLRTSAHEPVCDGTHREDRPRRTWTCGPSYSVRACRSVSCSPGPGRRCSSSSPQGSWPAASACSFSTEPTRRPTGTAREQRREDRVPQKLRPVAGDTQDRDWDRHLRTRRDGGSRNR